MQTMKTKYDLNNNTTLFEQYKRQPTQPNWTEHAESEHALITIHDKNNRYIFNKTQKSLLCSFLLFSFFSVVFFVVVVRLLDGLLKIRALFVISSINNNQKLRHPLESSVREAQVSIFLWKNSIGWCRLKNYFHHCYNKSEWLNKYTSTEVKVFFFCALILSLSRSLLLFLILMSFYLLAARFFFILLLQST